MTFQHVWYLRLAFCYVAVEEREEADVCKAQLSQEKGKEMATVSKTYN